MSLKKLTYPRIVFVGLLAVIFCFGMVVVKTMAVEEFPEADEREVVVNIYSELETTVDGDLVRSPFISEWDMRYRFLETFGSNTNTLYNQRFRARRGDNLSQMNGSETVQVIDDEHHSYDMSLDITSVTPNSDHYLDRIEVWAVGDGCANDPYASRTVDPNNGPNTGPGNEYLFTFPQVFEDWPEACGINVHLVHKRKQGVNIKVVSTNPGISYTITQSNSSLVENGTTPLLDADGNRSTYNEHFFPAPHSKLYTLTANLQPGYVIYAFDSIDGRPALPTNSANAFVAPGKEFVFYITREMSAAPLVTLTATNQTTGATRTATSNSTATIQLEATEGDEMLLEWDTENANSCKINWSNIRGQLPRCGSNTFTMPAVAPGDPSPEFSVTCTQLPIRPDGPCLTFEGN